MQEIMRANLERWNAKIKRDKKKIVWVERVFLG